MANAARMGHAGGFEEKAGTALRGLAAIVLLAAAVPVTPELPFSSPPLWTGQLRLRGGLVGGTPVLEHADVSDRMILDTPFRDVSGRLGRSVDLEQSPAPPATPSAWAAGRGDSGSAGEETRAEAEWGGRVSVPFTPLTPVVYDEALESSSCLDVGRWAGTGERARGGKEGEGERKEGKEEEGVVQDAEESTGLARASQGFRDLLVAWQLGGAVADGLPGQSACVHKHSHKHDESIQNTDTHKHTNARTHTYTCTHTHTHIHTHTHTHTHTHSHTADTPSIGNGASNVVEPLLLRFLHPPPPHALAPPAPKHSWGEVAVHTLWCQTLAHVYTHMHLPAHEHERMHSAAL
jgi:hypothetical protein